MQQCAPPQGSTTHTGLHFADSATVPRPCTWAWVWLGWLRLLAGGGHFVVASLAAEPGYGGWFLPSTGRRSGQYVHPVGVAPVPTSSGPQVTNPGPWISWVIQVYLVIYLVNPWHQKFPILRWTWRFEKESRDPPPLRGSQVRRWMKQMAWVPLQGYPSLRITQS